MKTICMLVAAVVIALGSGASGQELALTNPHALAVDGAGNVLVGVNGNAVVVLSREGKSLRQFGQDRLGGLSGMAVDAKGRILAANPARNEIAIFDDQGKFASAIEGLANPQALAVAPDGLIYVADTGNNRIAVVDSATGKVAFAIDKVDVGAGAVWLRSPMGVAVAEGKLAISDTGNNRVVLMARPTKSVEFHGMAIAHPDMQPLSIAMAKDGKVFVIDRGQVRGYDSFGTNLANFAARSSMWFNPATLTLDAKGNLFVTDRTTSRVMVTDTQLAECIPEVKLTKEDPTTAVIEWTTLRPTPTIVKYGDSEECKSEFKDAALKTAHAATIKNLSPATRYYYHINSPVETLPVVAKDKKDFGLSWQRASYGFLREGFSTEQAFVTMAPVGKTEWIAVPSIVLIYRHIAFEPDKEGKKAEDRVLNDQAMALIHSEMEQYRLWAWRGSACKMNLEFHYIVVDDVRQHKDLNCISPVVRDDVLAGLKKRGEDINKFWNVVVIGTHGWFAWYMGVVDGKYEMDSCHLKFDNNTKPGWYWFPTHEQGHVIDFMLEESGVPEFNHPDMPQVLKGQFGENFSYLACNYRQVPPRRWLLMRRSVMHQSVDANGNGVPDDDATVPMDEKRFGWTKEMGGDCMTRLKAGIRTPGCPGDTDTDFEGVKHKLNEGELYWVNRNVPQSSPAIDGKFDVKQWKELYSLPNMTTPKEQRGIKAKVYLAWDDGNYYVAIKSDKPVTMGMDLDAANDGWFHGRDNLRVNVHPAKADQPAQADGSIWDFLNDRINVNPDSGQWYKLAYKPADFKAASGSQDGWYVVEVAIPARPELRIAPGKGHQFGLRVYMTPLEPADAPGIGFFDGEDFIYNLTCTEPEPK